MEWRAPNMTSRAISEWLDADSDPPTSSGVSADHTYIAPSSRGIRARRHGRADDSGTSRVLSRHSAAAHDVREYRYTGRYNSTDLGGGLWDDDAERTSWRRHAGRPIDVARG